MTPEMRLGVLQNSAPAESEVYRKSFLVAPDFLPVRALWTEQFTVRRRHERTVMSTRWPPHVYFVVEAPDVMHKQLLFSLGRVLSNLPAKTELERRLVSAVDSLSQEERSRLKRDFISRQIAGIQGGREKIESGLARAPLHVPRCEEIFTAAGLPREFAWLALLESQYSNHAVSRSKAVGMWQFMSYTAQNYGLRRNAAVDERRDPLLSAMAAAKYLKSSLDKFGENIPLTITSYNRGPSGALKDALAAASVDLPKIAQRLKGRGSFEVGNYYPSFLSVLHIAQNQQTYFPDLKPVQPIPHREIRTSKSMSFRFALEKSGLTKEQFAELNPALQPAVFAGKVQIPKDVLLRVAPESPLLPN